MILQPATRIPHPVELEERVKKLILQQVGLFSHRSDLAALALEEKLAGTKLGYDSFDRIELFMALEEALTIDIPDDASDKFRTVGDVVRYCLDRAVASREGGHPVSRP